MNHLIPAIFDPNGSNDWSLLLATTAGAATGLASTFGPLPGAAVGALGGLVVGLLSGDSLGQIIVATVAGGLGGALGGVFGPKDVEYWAVFAAQEIFSSLSNLGRWGCAQNGW